MPLVELRTTHDLCLYSDSAGWVAIDESDLLGREVWFHLRSHGYEVAADGFGNRGLRLRLAPGSRHRVPIRRRNIAERLYRVTGAGRFHHSRRLGEAVPIPPPKGGVFGQDSVVNAIYRGRLYWFWGDTDRASYPLGNFAVSGAVSALPGRGGLDPERGVALDYFVDEGSGFCRKLCPMEGPGPVWIFGLMVHGEGPRSRMVTYFERIKTLGERYEHGIVAWDDQTQGFEKVRSWPLDARVHPYGAALRTEMEGRAYWVFPNPYPHLRVRDDWQAICDHRQYEAFTCLRAGADFDAQAPDIVRDAAGRPVWAWRRDTAAITPRRFRQMVEAGHLGEADGPLQLREATDGTRIQAHGGSISYNAHLGRWVMIFLQVEGSSSHLGEVWYAEAPQLMGPWGKAVKVCSHERYSFYNVKQHPYFAKNGGRRIYFEGTYTATFSGNKQPTPRYDYNQIMYALDVDDARLKILR